jgi:hypothetical protein
MNKTGNHCTGILRGKYEMKLFSVVTLIFMGFSPHKGAAVSNEIPMKFCAMSERINLDPFRDLKPNEVSYALLLARPILGKPHDKPLLEVFSPEADSVTFTGRLAKDLSWNDGTPAKAKDIAYGLAKVLANRGTQASFRVKGTQEINASDWALKEYSGIKILSDRDFQLSFETTVKNLPGLLLESFGNASGRSVVFWPRKLASLGEQKLTGKEVITKYPVTVGTDGNIELRYGSHVIHIVPKQNNCEGADFVTAAVAQAIDLTKGYSVSRNPNSAVGTVYINPTKVPSLEERAALAAVFRDVAAEVSEEMQRLGGTFRPVASHFLKSEEEPGWTEVNWGEVGAGIRKNPTPKSEKAKPLAIALSPIAQSSTKIFSFVKEKFAAHGYEVIWQNPEASDFDVTRIHAAILQSNVISKRQPWLQQILDIHYISKNMEKYYPKTAGSLQKIARESAATIPVKEATLREFEEYAYQERSFIPFCRASNTIYSKLSAPLEVVYGHDGFLNLKPKELRK